MPADAVIKAHASALDTFQSLDTGLLGRVDDGRVELLHERWPRRRVATEQAAEGVVLLTAHVAMDGALLDAAAALRPPGIVIEATGAGNTAASLLEAAERAIGQGIVVAFTTRCPAGAASAAYAFPGGGATWVRAGALLAGHLSGPKTRVALACGLGAGLTREALADLLADPPGWGPDRRDGAAATVRTPDRCHDAHNRLMPLDTLVSGRIATFAGASGFGWVEAIGIRDGKVAFAGTAIELETRADPHTRRIELEPGELAMPGITDAHLHIVGAALASSEIDLHRAASVDEAMALVAEAASRIPVPGWILGSGWDARRWGGWPSAAALERAAPGRLVTLQSADHHAACASPAALALAGVDASTPDPDGGVIRRSPDGAPDGVLFENASNLVEDLVPPPDPATVRGAVRAYARELLALGVVGAIDPGSLALDTTNRAHASYVELAEADELPVRVWACVRADGLDSAIERGIPSGGALAPGLEGRLEMGWLKLFADGTLGSQTAALLDPIEGTSNRGMFTMSPDEMRRHAAKARAAGISTMIHTIGDHAVREALDILGALAGRAAFMPRLEHVQLCDPADRPRFALLGVAASVQPIHLRADAAKARADWGARAESAGYTWKSLLDAGAVVAFGTDAPVEPADPWPGIALSVLRRDPSWGADAEAYGPNEAITLEQALRAATVGVAATRRDPLGGRLVPGSPADLIVLPAAPRESTDAAERAAAFAEVRPRLVMVGGDVELER